MTNGRVSSDLLTVSSEEASKYIEADDVILISGFGGVGYPKCVLGELAETKRELSLTVISGGGVGHEIDDKLVEADVIARRYPFQTRDTSRRAINSRSIAFHDRHISRFGDEVRLGHPGEPDIAIIEAVTVGNNWLIPSTSIGHIPSFVSAADRLIIEVNYSQPRALEELHDIYQRTLPPQREPIPLNHPIERIGSPHVEFDPDALVAVVETYEPDSPYQFRSPSEMDLAIAEHLRMFLQHELTQNSTLAERICLQFGVGSLGNALMSELSEVDFGEREVIYFGEVFQDGLLDALDEGFLAGASAASLALSKEGQRRLFDSINRYSENIVLRPADISNNPGLIDQFGVVGVNSAVEVDPHGNVNATHIQGKQVVSGIGGGGDFSLAETVGSELLHFRQWLQAAKSLELSH